MNTEYQGLDIFRDLYLNSLSVEALIPVAFFIIASFLLLSVKNKSKATLHMGLIYMLVGVYDFSTVFSSSVYHPVGAFHRWPSVATMLFLAIHLNAFFFYYPNEKNPRIAKLFIGVGYLISLILLINFIFVSYHAGYIYIFISHCWSFDAAAVTNTVTMVVSGYILLIPFFAAWRAITSKGKDRWVTLLIGLSFLIGTVAPAYFYSLSRTGEMDRETYRMVWAVFTILGFFLANMFYVNNAKEKISFTGRLIMVIAITILAILHFISFFALKESDTAYDNLHRKDASLVLHTGYRPADLGYVAEYSIDKKLFINRLGGELPADSSYFRSEVVNTAIYEQIRHLPAAGFAHKLKQLLDKTPLHFEGYKLAIMEYANQISQNENDPGRTVSLYIDHLNDKALVQFNKIKRLPNDNFRNALQKYLVSTDSWFAPYKSVLQNRLETSSQNDAALKSELLQNLLPVLPAGERIYRASEVGIRHYISYMEADLQNNRIFEVGFSYISYRQYMHDAVLKFVIMIIILILFSIYIFKWFIDAIIMKPLNALSKGVYAVDAGNYDISVPVFVEDEIGHIARSFNNMVVSIREGKQKLSDYANSLISAQTSLEESHREIRILQHYLSNIIESMPSVLISIDQEGMVTQWNAAAEKLTGIRATEILGKKLWNFPSPFHKLENFYRDVIHSGKPLMFTREHLEHTVGEENKYYNIALYPLVANGISGAVVRIDDITVQEKMEQQLRQAQKMDTVGTLAGGLAHDFNNILGGIVGTVSIVKFKLNKGMAIAPQALKEYMETMERSGKRATDMVQQLMTLSRKTELSFASVDLNMTIKHIVKICENTFDKAVELKPVYAKEYPVVNADPGQLEQVLLNLCVNASHAVTIMRPEHERRGGTITISLKDSMADKFFCNSHPEAALNTKYWILSVQDTGIGMDTKTIAKIFDPFFTMKEKGKGTGLGLAMVYNIIQQHKGFIDVYSEAGHGSTFSVYLPSLEGGKVEATVKKETLLSKGEGTVLVVDDEQIMRDLASEILEECGYSVLLAENGLAALEIFKKEHTRIRIVILDMVMPKLSGKDAFIELKKIDPDVKVLLASGFRRNENIEDIMELGVKDFIQKPFTIEELSEKVSKVLAGA